MGAIMLPSQMSGDAGSCCYDPLQTCIDDGCSDLENQMSTTWRPAHLLARSHPGMQQPLHRAFRRRGRERLVIQPRRRIIDDQIGEIG
jgi:hypothetical protein